MYPDEIPLGKAKNLKGKKIGKLTVLYRVANKGSRTRWKCLCDCGNITIVEAGHLNAGDTLSCGCNVAPNLIGQRFNQLKVIEKAYIGKDRAQYWKCQCDCGNIIYVNTANLKRGHTNSCGCYRISQLQKKICLDLTNKKFGKLTAIKPTNKRNNSSSSIIWECLCDCGNICYYPANELNANRYISCGCAISSKGETIIQQILRENKINFIRQKTFESCKDKQALPFDFFITEKKYLIEFDGRQHFKPIDFFGGDLAFQKCQKHDKIKNQWCKNHNIPLIRIPYTQLNNLCIKDLLLETSKFRII